MLGLHMGVNNKHNKYNIFLKGKCPSHNLNKFKICKNRLGKFLNDTVKILLSLNKPIKNE